MTQSQPPARSRQRPADPVAPTRLDGGEEWQPQVQHLHILVAPLLVFAVGMVWQRHIWSHWSKGVRKSRRTGLSMALTLVPMVVSGYLIQTAVDGGWRKAWVIVHLIASGLWLAGYLAHQVPVLWAWLRRRAVPVPAR
jgi:O-antigen/teichoic acid export membrane protein